MFMINCINYIIGVHAQKVTKFGAYIPCMHSTRLWNDL